MLTMTRHVFKPVSRGLTDLSRRADRSIIHVCPARSACQNDRKERVTGVLCPQYKHSAIRETSGGVLLRNPG